MTTGVPQAGWYPDPSGEPGQKYWDGRQWQSDGPDPTNAPFGVDVYGRPLSDKSKLVAGLLQILFSPLALGRWYLGYNDLATKQIVVTVVTCGFGAFWALFDGISILTGNVPDPDGRTLRN